MNTQKTETCRVGCHYHTVNRIVSLFLTIVMLLTITAGFNLSALANSNSDFTYQILNDGTISISGYSGSSEDAVIPSEIDGCIVSAISNGTFTYSNNYVKAVTIPASVTSIGKKALDNSNVEEINVSADNEYYSSQDGVLYNKDKTELVRFPNKNVITDYEIPKTVESINDYAFYSCNLLKNVKIPYGVKYIGSNAFCFCSALESIIIPDSVTSLGSYAFNACGNMKSVVLSENLTSIEERTFWGCTSLSDIAIPKSVKSIGNYAFFACESLKSIEIPDGVTCINEGTFYRCSALKKIIIPKSITDIGTDAFKRCSELTEILYSGSESDWNKIVVSENNDELSGSEIKFNYKGIIEMPFVDLQGEEYAPYKDYVAYTSVYNQFITGTNPPERTLFSPQTAITRAMFVTILYRMAGSPYDNGNNPYISNPFSDVPENSYYYNPACWALRNSITTEIAFKPYDNVSREQTASFLFRYAKENNMLGNEAYKNVNLSTYHDYNDIRDWAKEAMQWANYNGMITGTQQGYANPQGSTLRIHATKILYGFGKTCNIGNFE